MSVVPDYAEPIVAWRTWLIRTAVATGSRLCSVTRYEIWPAREALEATCWSLSLGGKLPATTNHKHPIPVQVCSCGIYATKEPSPSHLYPGFLGEVYLWGKIVEHEDGYRAQYAYPKTLVAEIVPDLFPKLPGVYYPLKRLRLPDEPYIHEIAERYGIEMATPAAADRHSRSSRASFGESGATHGPSANPERL